MDYLPSKKFTQKILALFLVIMGWFYFFGTKNIKPNQELLVDNGGIMVFSRTGQSYSKTDNTGGWGDLSKENNEMKAGSLAPITGTSTEEEKNILSELKRTTIAEINSFVTDNKTDYEIYGKDLVIALKPYGNPDLPNEGEITLETLNSGDPENLKKVALMSRLHLAVAEELRKIKTPEEIKFKHLFLLNDIETLSFVDQLMMDAFEDPKKAIDAIGLYKTTTRRFTNSIMDINNFFTEKGINFSKDEKVKIYINGIQ